MAPQTECLKPANLVLSRKEQIAHHASISSGGEACSRHDSKQANGSWAYQRADVGTDLRGHLVFIPPFIRQSQLSSCARVPPQPSEREYLLLSQLDQNKRKSVLFITPSVEMERASGGALVTVERLSALAKHHDVTVLAMHVDQMSVNLLTGITWRTAGFLRKRTIRTLLESYTKGLPLSVWRNSTKELLKSAQSLDKEFDLLYADHWLTIELAKVARAKTRILHLHNAEPEVFLRAAKSAKMPNRVVMHHEGRRTAAYLRNNISSFDALHLLSIDDCAALKVHGVSHAKCRVFLPAVRSPGKAPASFDTRSNKVLFVGTLSWYANEEGLNWYIEQVLPYTNPQHQSHIVGGGASQQLKSKLDSHPKTTPYGYVDNIETLYQTAKCLVAPLLSGSGIKIKIINALARGLPVVTTPVGIEGFPPGYSKAIRVTNCPKEFAESIEIFTSDGDLWRTASQNALDYFNAHFKGGEWQKWAGTIEI